MLGAPVLLGGLPHQNVLCIAVNGGVSLCCLNDVDGLEGNIATVDIEICLGMVLSVCPPVRLEVEKMGLTDRGQIQSRTGSSLVPVIVCMRAY
jgi:hypothetical protein